MDDDALIRLLKERIANDNGVRYSLDEVIEALGIDLDEDDG